MSNHYLPAVLRRALEKTAKDARVIAEDGARDAIRRLGIADSKAPAYLRDDEKELRRRLRAHARALGDVFDKTDETQGTKRLVEAAAYAHWHRLLFARFLAERGLLRNPEYDVPVSLEDCRELAEAAGLTDPWAIAERYAASMLPAVFRIDDPVLALQLDPVHTQKLHRLVTGLDAEIFQTEDSLGWTYQFWRAAEKKEVNDSAAKIGAEELPAATQLFTEPYMVRFLLHNTLGAWWAAKVLAANPSLARSAADENALRAACSLPHYNFDMLRFVREGEDGYWRPAAGSYPGWPKEAKAVTVLDPCCGSGHFLTEALVILAALRQTEESISQSEAAAAALRDNVFGLELDGRCVQLAAFATALTAWRIGGWQLLPPPRIAWVGSPPPLPKKEFVNLAGTDEELSRGLSAIYELFLQAPVLGSLINPLLGDLADERRISQLETNLDGLLEKSRRAEPELVEGVVSARGMSDATMLLSRKYTLQLTNVPYLGKNKQAPELQSFISRTFPSADPDLATAMISRMEEMACEGGSIGVVSPQSWLFQSSYGRFRKDVLTFSSVNCIAALGLKSFQTPMWDFHVMLIISTVTRPSDEHQICIIDASTSSETVQKQVDLVSESSRSIYQAKQLKNPQFKIVLGELSDHQPLGRIAQSFQGLKTGDDARWRAYFWEISALSKQWRVFQSTVPNSVAYGGRSSVLRFEDGGKDLARNQGRSAWGQRGVAVSQMAHLPVCIYDGHAFDSNVAPIVPLDPSDLPALFAYCTSSEFNIDVRKLDQKVAVANGTFAQLPFDKKRWTTFAANVFPDGIPEPYSDDPVESLFHGHPAGSSQGSALHCALARLCGYSWPAEADPNMRLSGEARTWIARTENLPSGDNDGLVGVPPVAGEKSLADRLRSYLAASFSTDWSDDLERRLIAESDKLLDNKVARDGSLEVWVRDRAFRQHCALFGQRPFLWHITDGLKDGFSVFVHYHRFDQANLRKLTYTLLGDWLARAKAENNTLRYEKGRELQQTLEKVLEGEKPYDIFVRWKSLAQQPLGWDPDLDDGVRQNIRPFIEAELLSHDLSKILKDKDRGTDIESAPWFSAFNGERRNDHHTTLAEKRAAREEAAKRVEAVKR